jgi:hypothetical protein
MTAIESEITSPWKLISVHRGSNTSLSIIRLFITNKYLNVVENAWMGIDMGELTANVIRCFRNYHLSQLDMGDQIDASELVWAWNGLTRLTFLGFLPWQVDRRNYTRSRDSRINSCWADIRRPAPTCPQHNDLVYQSYRTYQTWHSHGNKLFRHSPGLILQVAEGRSIYLDNSSLEQLQAIKAVVVYTHGFCSCLAQGCSSGSSSHSAKCFMMGKSIDIFLCMSWKCS